MKRIKDFFSKRDGQKHSQELMKITNAIGPLLDQTAHEIFSLHSSELLKKPLTYIIPAVWGVNNDVKLTEIQIRINKRIVPVVDEILRLFNAREMDPAQQNALDYIVRGLIISKITFMIELLKNQMLMSAAHNSKENNILKDILDAEEASEKMVREAHQKAGEIKKDADKEAQQIRVKIKESIVSSIRIETEKMLRKAEIETEKIRAEALQNTEKEIEKLRKLVSRKKDKVIECLVEDVLGYGK